MALIHGGDMEGFRMEYGREPLDFSANCNPLGIPAKVRSAICSAAEKADAYPDPLCRQLRSAIAEHESIDVENILCANGSADIIYRLAAAVKPKKALVTAPTFSEYEAALEASHCTIRYHMLDVQENFAVTPKILDDIDENLDMLFICNPNNPTGLTVDHDLLEDILNKCESCGALLIVDECFVGFLDEPDNHTLKERLSECSKLIILKAFTKLYGMAGVRLGYCLSSNTKLLEDIRNAGQPWAVSSLAQAAGIAALQQHDYVRQARRIVREEREYLLEGLSSLGVKYLSGEANYIFFYSEITELAQRMRCKGILIRDCSNYEGLSEGCYRIAVRTHKDNEQLIQVLRESAQEGSA